MLKHIGNLDLLQQSSDIEICRQIQTGESTLFEQIIQRYERRLIAAAIRYGARQNGHMTPADAVDWLWLKVLTKIREGDYPLDKSFYWWLIGILRNIFRTSSENPIPNTVRILQYENEINGIIEPQSPALLADETAMNGELFDALCGCVDNLPPKLYEIYSMIYVQGLKFTETAEYLGCSEAYVRQKLHPKLLDALRICLSNKGFNNQDDVMIKR